MRKKSKKVCDFIDGLHAFIVRHPQFRNKVSGKKEARIHAELRPVITRYLENYFKKAGYRDPLTRAHEHFYWEGQERKLRTVREATFGSRNYPDFIILRPYRMAIEYKQSRSGSTVKHGIGQSIMHTLSGDFDFVYYLFHDETPDKRIARSVRGAAEKLTMERVWRDFNVRIKIV